MTKEQHPAAYNQSFGALGAVLYLHGNAVGRHRAADCPRGIKCIEGLQYQAWRCKDCEEAVIAFRGSDAGDIGDWLSNSRWSASPPLFDQYDQVQQAIPGIIDRLYAGGCRPWCIIATGHSLGGGLPQHVAYADSRIDDVDGFNLSPVTAFFGVPLPVRMAAAAKLGIDRVDEAGDNLVAAASSWRPAFSLSTQCRPRVRIVRFATLRVPSLLERHRITNLTDGPRTLGGAGQPTRWLPVGVGCGAHVHLRAGGQEAGNVVGLSAPPRAARSCANATLQPA